MNLVRLRQIGRECRSVRERTAYKGTMNVQFHEVANTAGRDACHYAFNFARRNRTKKLQLSSQLHG